MEQQSCQLPRLSPELIFMIVGYNDPPDILALSLTCSDLHHRCRSLLEQHQNAYKTYRITSDLSPETAVDLLKDTLTAEINRDHVRELEFWGSRLKWEDWRSWDPALSDNYQVAAEEEPSRSAWDAREIEEYIQKGFRLWDLTEEKIEELRMSLDRGSEAWLKLLLICLCPRLRSIRFVKRRGESYNILAWMAMIIGWSVEDGCHWPPGFESLRKEEEYYAGFEEFTKLFHIPNLKNIYFSGLSCQEFFWEEHIWNEELLPNGTSNVEILFLDGVEGGWDEFYDWLSGASIKLDTVVLRATDSHRGGLDDVSNLVDSLAETNDNLRRLVLYHPAAMHQLYRQAGIYNHESVKQITLAVRDFDYRFNYTVNDWTFREPDSPIAFPPNVEAVYIWGGLNGRSRSWRRYIEHFDLFLATLIESGVHKQLKVVYVEHVERTSTKSIISLNIIGWREFAFPKATAAGRKAGVHVCTIMNRDDGGYWKNFPARPDRFDIKTGPFAAERPEEWKLNLYTGQWGPDCNGCGECEECLAVYPSELWEENAARRSSSD